MEDVVRDGKILLINLNGVRIGQQTASIIGTLVMNSVWNAVRTTKHEKPVILYMDEFQNFVTMPTSPSEMLAQSRSFGLGMVLAHQHTGQLKNELRDAVLANARSKIVFQTTANDARLMAAEFGSQVRMEDFMNLRHREAISRVTTSTGVSAPFTMRTRNLSKPTSNPRYIRELSRSKYGRPVEIVEQSIEVRRQGTKKPGKRPSIGWKTLDDEQSA
jgi:type IV secretory pathway TraG/TraD family ATPase VirD4